MEKKRMCKLIKPYVCKKCGNELLFFVTRDRDLLDYKALFENATTSTEIYRDLQYDDIKHLKCIVCDQSFLIDWSNHYPQQLTDREALKKFGV